MYTIGYSLDELIQDIPEYQIYAYYIGSNFKVGNPIHSPLRVKDNTPSFSIFYSLKNSKLMYKDFGTGESGDCIEFVKNKLNLRSKKEAKFRIFNDFCSNPIPKIGSFKYEPVFTQERANLSIEEQELTDTDVRYWLSYNVTVKTLSHFNVVSVSKLFNEDKIVWFYNEHNPIYGYKINKAVKCYRPYGGKGNKFRTNCSIRDIQGYEQLPDKGELLIITKSMKDVMVLYELGYIAIAPNSEGVGIPTDIISDLKERFQKIIVLYDNDEAGIKAANKLKNQFSLLTVIIPLEYNSKDISDLTYNLKNISKTMKIFKTLIDGC